MRKASNHLKSGQSYSVLTVGRALREASKLWFESSRPVVSHFTIYEDEVVAVESYDVNLTGKLFAFFPDPFHMASAIGELQIKNMMENKIDRLHAETKIGPRSSL